MRVRILFLAGMLCAVGAANATAQMGPPPGGGMPPQHGAPPGQWWQNAEIAKMLALTTAQKSTIDGILQQDRMHLFELSTAVQREDMAMEGLMDADQPDEGKILAQVDKLAGARAELEKANARMLLAMRKVLTPEQWRKLQAFNHSHPPPGHGPGE